MAQRTKRLGKGAGGEQHKGRANGLWSAALGGVDANSIEDTGDAGVNGAGLGAVEGPGEGSGEGSLSSASEYGGAVATPTAISSINTPSYKQPGFFKNLLTRGAAGQRTDAANQAIARLNYEGQVREALAQQARAAKLEEMGLTQGNALSLAEQKNRLENSTMLQRIQAEEDSKRRGELTSHYYGDESAKLKTALDAGLDSFDTFKSSKVPITQAQNQFSLAELQAKLQGAARPEFNPAVINSMMAGYRKPVLDNSASEATTEATRAKIPASEFMPLGPDAMYNPRTRQLLQNSPALKDEPFKYGGVTSSSLGGPVRSPGGVNAEMDLGFRGVGAGSDWGSPSTPTAEEVVTPPLVGSAQPFNFGPPLPPYQTPDMNPAHNDIATPPLNQMLNNFIQRQIPGTGFENSSLDQYLKRKKLLGY